MRAQLKISEANNTFQQEALTRCLNRIMEVKIIDLNLKKKLISVEFTGPKVLQKILNEIERLGLAIRDKKILPDPFSTYSSTQETVKVRKA